MKQSGLAYVFVGLAVLLWGSSAAVGKLLLADLSSLQVSFYTFIIATATLFLLAVFQGKLAIISTYKIKAYARTSSRDDDCFASHNLLLPITLI